MIIVVISQRAIPSPDFRLRDLPGHGRIDIVMRCILAARRPLPASEPAQIYCFLKGGDSKGWINWGDESDLVGEDEVSIAAKIRGNWNKYFTTGTLDELLAQFGSREVILLTEDGNDRKQLNILDYQNGIIVVGAQNEPSEDDIDILTPHFTLSLGKEAMLASQAITLFRQLSAQTGVMD